MDYRILPGYAAWFDVALIPFRLNEITRATSPLKLYEYFAAGRPVVSTALPECEAFPEVRIVHSAAELSEALDAARVDARNPQFVERLRAIGRQNSWQARVEAVLACWGSSEAAASTAAYSTVQGTETRSPSAASTSGFASSAGAGGGRRVAGRFANHRRPDNSRFHAALADHFASVETDPALAMWFEFAVTANDRGRRLVELIARRRPLQGARVLDIGCAYGGMVVAFAERGCQVTGIDINESLLQLGQANLADQRVSAPLLSRDASAPAPDFVAAFDLIVANDVIEHVADLDSFLDNLALWLRPAACAYLEIPNGKAVEAVLSDGQHALFGITLLDYPDAAAYLRAARGSEYDTYHYLRLEEYLERFRARGLGVEVLERSWENRTIAGLREALDKLTSTVETSIVEVPEPLRPVVRARVTEYVREVRRCFGVIPEQEAILRYGSSFWTAELTKRASA
jgi:2-polyprenyl-3-methyl-5-hydroxy-6-metoxy-1,4-benzoquinol methylase